VIAPYLDSSAIIYLLEGSATVRTQVAATSQARRETRRAGSSHRILPGWNAG